MDTRGDEVIDYLEPTTEMPGHRKGVRLIEASVIAGIIQILMSVTLSPGPVVGNIFAYIVMMGMGSLIALAGGILALAGVIQLQRSQIGGVKKLKSCGIIISAVNAVCLGSFIHIMIIDLQRL